MSQTLRILVVDDARSMARTLVDIFRVKGCEAEVASSAIKEPSQLLDGSSPPGVG